jgi:hypothetical protein
MQHDQPRHHGGARLRFVFDDGVMLFDLRADATFEDVALKLGDPGLRGRGRPIAIFVARPSRAPEGSFSGERIEPQRA